MIRALYPGCLESVKAGVHGVLCGSAGLCLLYNVCALIVRPKEKHLAVNVLIYTAIVVLEVHQVGHHLKRLP